VNNVAAYYLLLQIEHATRYTYHEAKAMWDERQSDGPWPPKTTCAIRTSVRY
jgi:hypothetical protein